MAGGAARLIEEFAARSPTKPTYCCAFKFASALHCNSGSAAARSSPLRLRRKRTAGFGDSPDLAERPIKGAKLSVERLRFSYSLWGRRNRRCYAGFCEWCPTGDKTGHSDHWRISFKRC